MTLLERIQNDPRYQSNLDWGTPRTGHPEGSLRAHITELERNLASLAPKLTTEEQHQLRLLIHVHDTFKPDATDGVSIRDPRSHASLARAFLAEFSDDEDLLAMVQWHDEPFALWQQFRHKGLHSQSRFESLLNAISDWELFVAFLIVDACTAGKDRQPLVWFLCLIEDRRPTRWTVADLPGT